jgi:hypothetical protein
MIPRTVMRSSQVIVRATTGNRQPPNKCKPRKVFERESETRPDIEAVVSNRVVDRHTLAGGLVCVYRALLSAPFGLFTQPIWF